MYSSLALITIALCHPALSISVVPDTFFPDIATSFQVIVVEPSLLLVISAPSASNWSREPAVSSNRLSITSVTVAVTGILFVMFSNKLDKLLTPSTARSSSKSFVPPGAGTPSVKNTTIFLRPAVWSTFSQLLEEFSENTWLALFRPVAGQVSPPVVKPFMVLIMSLFEVPTLANVYLFLVIFFISPSVEKVTIPTRQSEFFSATLSTNLVAAFLKASIFVFVEYWAT